MRDSLVRALVGVGCPVDLAERTVDRYGEVEVDGVEAGSDGVYVADVGCGWNAANRREDFEDSARDLAARLVHSNAELRSRAARGESVPVFWPIRRARSGDVCPASGTWIADGVDRAPEAFGLGTLLPTLDDRSVMWHQIG